MSKKFIGMLLIPVAVAAVAGGAFITYQVNAASPHAAQQANDKAEPGDTPDTPGKSDKQDKQDTPDTQDNGQDGETND